MNIELYVNHTYCNCIILVYRYYKYNSLPTNLKNLAVITVIIKKKDLISFLND